jgi:pimeloyl-ACP methyl ester carboxylesterase
MLSKLLRRLILSQALSGALLGWYISRSWSEVPWRVGASTLGLGLAMPFMLMLLLTACAVVRSRPPGGHVRPWRLLAGEYVANCRVFIGRQPWARRAPGVNFSPALSGAPPRVPVLLVHGYLCNHRVWDSLLNPLCRAGHPVLRVDLEPLFASIDKYAPLLEQAVDRLCQQSGAQEVALVGHSMGGLVIRAWMRSHGQQRVARVITLGSPHVGTLADRHPLTPNGKQMLWRSDWLHTLASDESAATHQHMRLGLSPSDTIDYPQREQILPGAAVTVFEGLGHMELCLNEHVIQWVLQQLEDTPDAALAE